MIWSDSKIERRFNAGMIHGYGGPGSGAGPGGEAGNAEAASGMGMGGGGGGTDFSRSRREKAPAAAPDDDEAPSMFGSYLSGLVDTATGYAQDNLGKLAGAVLGFGVGGPAMMGVGAKVGGMFDDNQAAGLTQAPPGGAAPTQTAALGSSPASAQVGLAGVSTGTQGMQGNMLGGQQMGGFGGDSAGAPAQQLAAAGRTSGLASNPQPQLGGGLPAQQYIDSTGALPTVNLGQFQNYLGRA